VRAIAGELRADKLADLFFDLVDLREAVEGVLGKDLLPIQKDFERSRRAGGHSHRPQLIGVIVQQVLRQTGGSSKIPSGGAVLDPHGGFLPGWSLAGDFVSHVISSVRLRSCGNLE
jgi:hypothetical protein